MSLIAWYPLDGNAEDYSVNKNHGTPTNVSWVNGKIGQAGSFEPVNSSQIIIPLLEFTGEFSYALWVNPSAINSTNMFFGGRLDSLSSNIKYGFLGGNFFIRVISSNRQVSIPNIQGVWSHIVITRDSENKIDFYLNGVGQRLFSDSSQSGTTYLNVIGNTTDGSNQYFHGLINDVRIYDHALSQKEINDLAKAKVLHYTFNRDDALVMDASGYKRHGSKHGITYTQGKLGSGAYSFDGADDRIQVDNFFGGSNELTIAFNIYFDTSTQDACAIGNWYATDKNILLYHDVPLGWRLLVTLDGNTTIDSQSDIVTPVNEWYHLTVSYNKGVIKFYVNGVLEHTRSVTNTTPIRSSNSPFFIGTDNNLSRDFDGIIDDYRMYSTALSDADILDLYQTRVKFDDAGNVYANEFVEDYEVVDGLTLTQLFEYKNELSNPSFEEGTNEWTLTGVVWENGYLKSDGTTEIIRVIQPFTKILNDKIYVNFYIDNISLTGDWYLSGSGFGNFSDLLGAINGRFSKIVDVADASKPFRIVNISPSTTREFRLDDFYNINTTKLVRDGYFATEPTQAQMDAWYRDYSRVRPNAKGQMMAREFNEVGIDTKFPELNNLSLREVFEGGNQFNQNNLGDFWNTGVLTTSNNEHIITVDTPQTVLGFSFNVLDSIDDKIYINYDFYTTTSIEYTAPHFYGGIAFITLDTKYLNPIVNKYLNHSTILETKNPSVSILTFYKPTNFQNGDIVKIKNIYAINLKTEFGAGNEPTQEQMDTWYNRYRQFKLTTQQQRITKDTLVINGEFKEV